MVHHDREGNPYLHACLDDLSKTNPRIQEMLLRKSERDVAGFGRRLAGRPQTP